MLATEVGNNTFRVFSLLVSHLAVLLSLFQTAERLNYASHCSCLSVAVALHVCLATALCLLPTP
jgi:hypothetical protein